MFSLCFAYYTEAQGQIGQDINSGGGVHNNGNIDISFSIGQPDYNIQIGPSSRITAGFQQGGGNYAINVNTDSVNCFGQSDGSAAVGTINGVPNYQISWSGGATGNQATGLSAGQYTVNAIDGLGYESQASFEVLQPDTLIAFNGFPNFEQEICPFEPVQLNLVVQGGTAPYFYNWGNIPGISNPNSPNPTISGFPSSSFTYNPTVIDNNGCTVTVPYNIVNDDPVFRGRVFYNGSPVNDSDVQMFLLPLDYTGGSFENVDFIFNGYPDSTFTDQNGNYTVKGNVFSDRYLVLARPRDFNALPNAVNTYYKQSTSGQQYRWQVADTVYAVCGDTINNLNINMLTFPTLAGPARLSGFVRWWEAKTQANNDPIPLIDVVVEKDSLPLRYTVTDTNGYYEFEDLPLDTCYRIYINYAGLNMYGNYVSCPTFLNPEYENLNFWIDTLGAGSDQGPGIYTSPPVGLVDPNREPNWVLLYPNPTIDGMTLQLKHTDNNPVDIFIKNVAGQLVLERKNYTLRQLYLSSDDFPPAMYFVEVRRKYWSLYNKIVFE